MTASFPRTQRLGRVRRAGLLTAALLAVAVAAPAASNAATASKSGSTVTVTAGAGEANDLKITVSGSDFRIDEDGWGVSLSAGSGCVSGGATIVNCATAGVTSVVVDAGDLNDSVDTNISTSVTLLGGDGNDGLVGGSGSDTIDGGVGDDGFSGRMGGDTFVGGAGSDFVSYSTRTNPVIVDLDGVADDGESGENDNVGTDVESLVGGSGNDTLVGNSSANSLYGYPGNDTIGGGGGNDYLNGSSGDDTLNGDSGDDLLGGYTGADAFNGGPDTDAASYQGRSNAVIADIDGVADDGETGENDNVGTDVENITGGDAGDTLTGDGGANRLDGGPGDDTLEGGAGADDVRGDAGADSLRLRDSQRDSAACGTENDSVVSDTSDDVAGDCEQNDPGQESASGGQTQPAHPVTEIAPVTFTLQAAVMTRKGIVPLPLSCPKIDGLAYCKGKLVLTIASPRGKARASKKPRRTVIGKANFRIRAGSTGTVKVRISRNGRRRVLRQRKLRCKASAVVVGADGKPRTVTTTIVLKAPKR
jgi:Ca2+-binding RTX toxin-like protein